MIITIASALIQKNEWMKQTIQNMNKIIIVNF